jgi:hypothetical protein
MPLRNRFLRFASAPLLPLLLAACAPGTKTPGWDFSPAETPPPPPEYVNPTVPTGDHYVWEMGHWEKNGQDYSWVPGRYVEQPEGGSISAGGRWIYTGNGQWIWIPGHWRKP